MRFEKRKTTAVEWIYSTVYRNLQQRSITVKFEGCNHPSQILFFYPYHLFCRIYQQFWHRHLIILIIILPSHNLQEIRIILISAADIVYLILISVVLDLLLKAPLEGVPLLSVGMIDIDK
jgi:hypothetical protein